MLQETIEATDQMTPMFRNSLGTNLMAVSWDNLILSLTVMWVKLTLNVPTDLQIHQLTAVRPKWSTEHKTDLSKSKQCCWYEWNDSNLNECLSHTKEQKEPDLKNKTKLIAVSDFCMSNNNYSYTIIL